MPRCQDRVCGRVIIKTNVNYFPPGFVTTMAAVFATKPLVASKSFNLKYAFRPVISLNPAIFKNIYHPLHEKVLEKLKEKERPQLIIDIVATIKRTSPKAVVRNRSKRRIREATHQVLKENGYQKDGKAEGGNKKDLVGTLAFFTTTETVLTPWMELKEEVRRGVVKWIVLRQKESKLVWNSGREDARPRRGEQFVQNGYPSYGRGAGREAVSEVGGGYKRDVREGGGVRVSGGSGRASGGLATGSGGYLRGGGGYQRATRAASASPGGTPNGNGGSGSGRGTKSQFGEREGKRERTVQTGGVGCEGIRREFRSEVRSLGFVGNKYVKFQAKDPAQRRF